MKIIKLHKNMDPQEIMSSFIGRKNKNLEICKTRDVNKIIVKRAVCITIGILASWLTLLALKKYRPENKEFVNPHVINEIYLLCGMVG